MITVPLHGVSSTGSAQVSFSAAPQAGDVVIYHVFSARAPGPRTVTSVSGMGGTWTPLYNPTGTRSSWWICTDATTSENVTASFDFGTPTASAAAWVLRGVPAGAALLERAMTQADPATVLAGPAMDATVDQIVLAHGRVASAPIGGPTPLEPATGWVELGSSSNSDAAYRVPAGPGTHQVETTCAVSGFMMTSQAVFGIAPPPEPPTGLAQTAATSATLEVSWTPPAAGTAPTGYDLRIDGGPVTAVGLVTTHTITGLTPDTDYLVEVRATNAHGSSSWAAVTGSTTAGPTPAGPADYTAHLRVGAHEWDVDTTEPPGYGPLAGLQFSWNAPQDDGWPTQHNPTLLTCGILVAAGVDLADVDQGDTVHYTFTPHGHATPLVTFGGTVRDLTGRPHPRGMVYELTAVDHLQALAEDYSTSVSMADGEALALLWSRTMQDRDGAGAGIGTRPVLPDPFAGDVTPLAGAGTAGEDMVFTDVPTWDLLTGISASVPVKDGATPAYQRPVFTYQLDAAGDLDAAHPFEGTWAMAGHGTPVEVPGELLPTAATHWSRPRIEPNRVVTPTGAAFERPHTGVTITRTMDAGPAPFLGTYTDPVWVLSGLDSPDQWSTVVRIWAARAPDLVAGFFDLPAAMRIAVSGVGIDPRHTPNGTGTVFGLLAGAALVIPPGGDWYVAAALRKTLPDPADPNTGGWS